MLLETTSLMKLPSSLSLLIMLFLPIRPEIQSLESILPLWRRGVIDEETTTKSDEGASRTSTGFRQSRPEEARPDFAASNGSHTPDSGGGVFDEDDYASLQARYLMPRIREKVELAGGITLRRQCRGRILDQKSRGCRMLRSKVDALTRKNHHVEVYQLLCQLRDWELDPRRMPSAFREGWDKDVSEVLDLTKDEDERPGSACINVDEYITNDLLVPLEISSCLVSKRTPSRQHNCCVPPYEEPANACNQIFQETKSSSSNCQCDAPASTTNDHHQRSPCLTDEYEIDESLFPVQITPCGIEELEVYAYAVIETVNHECGFSYRTNGAHTMTTMDEPDNYLRAAPDHILPAKRRNCFIKIPPSPMVDLTIDSGDDYDVNLLRGDGAEKEETVATNSDDGGGRRSPTSLVASLPRDSGGRTIREVRVTIRRVEVEVASHSNHNDIVSPGGDLSFVGEEVITPRGGLVANEEMTTKSEDDTAPAGTRRLSGLQTGVAQKGSAKIRGVKQEPRPHHPRGGSRPGRSRESLYQVPRSAHS